MRSIFLAAVCCALPFTAQAQSYTAFNRLVVVPLNPTDFEVIESRGEGARGLWCAAASFAKDRLRVPRGSRIYIKQPRGPSVSGAGRKGVVFTISAQGITPVSAYSISVRQPGLGLPQHHALQFCRDYAIELEDRF